MSGSWMNHDAGIAGKRSHRVTADFRMDAPSAKTEVVKERSGKNVSSSRPGDTSSGATGDVTATAPVPFGIDPLCPDGVRRIEFVGDARRARLRDKFKKSCPQVPGVYGMIDKHGDLIYVGKSKQLRSRVMSYFADSHRKEKGGRIIAGARAIQWETQPSEFASLLREQQLIRKFSPRWNVQGVPKRQRPVYLCLGRNPATFFVAAKPPAASASLVAIEGPFYGVGRMRLAVDTLNKTFGLRDCSNKQVFHFQDQLDLFDMQYRPGCLRLETGTCLGPCAAACTRTDYGVAVNAAQSFMEGFNHEPLVVTRDAFERAMQNQQYELAGRFHATIKSLEYIDRKLSLLSSARRTHTFVYDVPGYDGRNRWYFIRHGEVADVVIAPRDKTDHRRIKPQINRWRKISKTTISRGDGDYPHTLSVVAPWFRRNKNEMQQTFAVESAIIK